MSETERHWIEWGVRRTWGVVGSVAWFERDYRTARKCAKDWPGVLVHRIVTTSDWTDGEPTRADLARRRETDTREMTEETADE